MTIEIPDNRTIPLVANGGGFRSNGLVTSASGSGIDVSWTGRGIGDTVTITTSTLDFTTKANANPLWYVDPGAEGTIDASPLSRLTTSLSGRPLGNLDTSTTYGPNGSATASLVGTSPDWQVASGSLGPSLGNLKTNGSGAGDHIRIMTRWRRNFDGLDAHSKWQALNSGGSAWNIKRWRWYSEVGSPKNNLVFAYGQVNSEDGDARITPENSATGTDNQAGADLALYGMKKDQWVSEVVEIEQSSAAGVNDGSVRHIADGQEHLFSNVITYDDDANDGRYVDLVMEQWQFIYTDTPFTLWHDYIYVDDTPHAVIITDKPNWGDENAIIDAVIPTAWNGTIITAQNRCPLFGYLYVIDGNGSVLNSAGVNLDG